MTHYTGSPLEINGANQYTAMDKGEYSLASQFKMVPTLVMPTIPFSGIDKSQTMAINH